MGFVETAVLYLLVGLAVSAALVLQGQRSLAAQVGLFASGLAFWPLLLPTLIGGRSAPLAARPTDVGARVKAAQERLAAAAAQLDGLGDVVAPEMQRIRGLGGAIAAMEERLAEMDALLATPEFDAQEVRRALDGLAARAVPEDDARVQSVRARLRNVERLVSLRHRTSAELERIVLRLEELSGRLRLLRFAGEGDADVLAAFKDVAAAVEGITEELMATG